MKIAIIGTTIYRIKMCEYGAILFLQNHKYKLAAFDDFNGTELEMCQHNRKIISWADEVHVFWDGRSIGTIFDLGMCFALRKKIKLIYLQEKTFANLIKQMADK